MYAFLVLSDGSIQFVILLPRIIKFIPFQDVLNWRFLCFSDRVAIGRALDLPVYFGDAGSREVKYSKSCQNAYLQMNI